MKTKAERGVMNDRCITMCSRQVNTAFSAEEDAALSPSAVTSRLGFIPNSPRGALASECKTSYQTVKLLWLHKHYRNCVVTQQGNTQLTILLSMVTLTQKGFSGINLLSVQLLFS